MPKRRTGGECQTSSDSAANLPKRKDLPPLRLFVLFFVGFFLLLFFLLLGKEKKKQLLFIGWVFPLPAHATHVPVLCL